MTPIRVESFDGTEINANRYRGAEGETLVFVHGLACSHEFWREQTAEFSRTHDVILLDLQGHGASVGEREVMSIERFARDVESVPDYFEVSAANLVGHSMGGAVVLDVARLCPDRVVRVIGVDTYTYPDYYPRASESDVKAIVGTLEADFEQSFAAAIEPLFVHATAPVLKTWIVEAMLATSPAITTAALAALLRWDLDAALAASRLTPACINSAEFLSSTALSRYVDRLQVEPFPEAGHFLMLEAPQRFNAVLRKHLA